jgi:DNA-binding NarL/FixJ family response regulator
LFRTSLARLLAAETGFEVVSECSTSAEALELINASPIDIILLDFDLMSEQASDFISAARTAGYQGRFLIVAEKADVESSALALKLGASGIFLTSEVAERLVQAIRHVAAGAIWVDERVLRLLADQCLDQYSRWRDRKSKFLQEQEQKVLLGILDGLTNKNIGIRLGISEGYVKWIVQRLFAMAGVRKRSQLVRLAIEGSGGKISGNHETAGA